jgi:RecA/RadA recombinase
MGGIDRSLALSLENLLEGRGLVKKSAALSLLTGMGAKLSRASDLPSPAARRETLPTRVPALDRLLEGGLPRGGFVEI